MMTAALSPSYLDSRIETSWVSPSSRRIPDPSLMSLPTMPLRISSSFTFGCELPEQPITIANIHPAATSPHLSIAVLIWRSFLREQRFRGLLVEACPPINVVSHPSESPQASAGRG